MSHETAHGTAFRTRWLNETVMWICALLYLEEPLHRRYTHTNHHTYTWHVGKDSQMPFDTPMTLAVWIMEISGFSLTRFHIHRLIQLAAGHYTETLRSVVPEDEFPRLRRNARCFLGIYISVGAAISFGETWLWWFLVLPALLGRPVVLLMTSNSACRDDREFPFNSQQHTLVQKQSYRIFSLPEYGKSCGAPSLPSSSLFCTTGSSPGTKRSAPDS